MTDPIADLISRIKNAYMASKQSLTVPFSNMKLAICEVLVREEFLKSVKTEERDGRKVLDIELLYKNKEASLVNIRQISKPGIRIYSGSKDIRRPLGGAGIAIVSTPKGVMSNKQARQENVGGEVICQVW